MKKLLLLALLLTGMATVYAQQKMVCQLVNENGEPLAYANVIVKQNGVFKSGTVSDWGGIFEVYVTENQSIEVSSIGMEKQYFSFDEIFEKDIIEMKTAAYSLDLVVVTALRKRKEICGLSGCGTYYFPQTIDLSISLQSNWQYYPNPTRDVLFIDNELEKDGILTVYDSNGALLAQQQLVQVPYQLDLSQYPAGTYILQYQKGDTVETIGRVVRARF